MTSRKKSLFSSGTWTLTGQPYSSGWLYSHVHMSGSNWIQWAAKNNKSVYFTKNKLLLYMSQYKELLCESTLTE